MTNKLNLQQSKQEPAYTNQLHATEPRWFAVFTGPKREKIAAKQLESRGVKVYVPLNRVKRVYKSKTKTVELPLINCYIFVQVVKSQYVQVLQTPYVQRFLKLRGHLLAIPSAEIDLLRRIVGEIDIVEVDSDTLRTGDEVEVIAGQLTGLSGILEEKLGRKRLVVKLKSIGCDLLMEISPNNLRKIRSGQRA